MEIERKTGKTYFNIRLDSDEISRLKTCLYNCNVSEAGNIELRDSLVSRIEVLQ